MAAASGDAPEVEEIVESVGEEGEEAPYVDAGEGRMYPAHVKGKISKEKRRNISKAKEKIGRDQHLLTKRSGEKEGRFAGEYALGSYSSPAGAMVVKGKREHEEQERKNLQTTLNEGKQSLIELRLQAQHLAEEIKAKETEISVIEENESKIEEPEEDDDIGKKVKQMEDLGATPMQNLTLNDYIYVLKMLQSKKN
jgi:hypothetical protein